MMENRIQKKFEELRSLSKKAFVSYTMAGDHSLRLTIELMHKMVESGVDVIELGMPFSDPMAEGPTIQKAAERALNNKVKQCDVLKIVEEFRNKDNKTPIILMGYFNPINNYGLEKFVVESKLSGVDGFIIVDLPPEEDEDFFSLLQQNNLSFIKLTTPTTDSTRATKILNSASGFVYYISVLGVTGVKSADFSDVKSKISEIKNHTNLPICVGFGIKTPEQAKQAADTADGVVVGSAFVKIIEDNYNSEEDILEKYGILAQSIRNAIDG